MYSKTTINEKNSTNNGFTLVETLIAVAILMISIAGPLVVADKGLKAALYAKDQATASFLAQEGLELIRNAKDVVVSQDATNGFENLFFNAAGQFTNCSSNNTVHTKCGIYITKVGNTTQITEGDCAVLLNCLLYQDSTIPEFGYTNLTAAGTAVSTGFTRYFTFYKNATLTNEVQVVVEVDWQEGTVSNSVVLTGQMVNEAL